MSLRDSVRQFLVANFYVSDPAALADDASLVGGGWVDSTGFLEVIGFVESELGVPVSDVEMTPDNFDSIARIAAFVERRRSAAALRSAG